MSMDDIFKLPKGDSDLTDISGKKKAKKKKGKQKFIETPYGRFPVWQEKVVQRNTKTTIANLK